MYGRSAGITKTSRNSNKVEGFRSRGTVPRKNQKRKKEGDSSDGGPILEMGIGWLGGVYTEYLGGVRVLRRRKKRGRGGTNIYGN